jgi:hypothetical protein
MQPVALAGQQVGVERFPQERVPGVVLVAGDDEQPVGDRLLQRELQLARRQAGDGGDQLLAAASADSGHGTQHRPRRRAESFDAGQQDVAQARGELGARRAGRQQLLD